MFGRYQFTGAPPQGVYWRLVAVGFGILFASMIYCALHGFEDERFSFDPGVTLRWSVPRWGAWPLLLPACYWLMRSAHRRAMPARGLVAAAVAAVVGAVAFAYGAQAAFGRATTVFAVTYHMAPPAAATFALCVAAGFWLLRPEASSSAVRSTVDTGDVGLILPVSKGRLQTVLDVREVEWVRAAGNYVELFVDGAVYMARSSMVGLERRLPADTFLRVHRSYMVRTSDIVGLTGGRSRPILIMTSGSHVPVGKSYRSAVFDRLRARSGPR